jgi:hypothetical protein
MDERLEQYLTESLVPSTDQLTRRAKRAASLAARLAKAAADGDMKTVEAALRDLQGVSLDEPTSEVQQAAGAFDYRAYLTEGFAAEFEAACRETNLPLEGDFPAYTVFPISVRIDLDNPSVLVNRRRTGMLRPSSLVRAIQDERERLERSPFNLTEFLGVLFATWERMNAVQSAKSGVQVRQPQALKQVYRELVPFARWRRDYPEAFFAFDIQRLLLSGESMVGGWQCALEKGRGGSNALRLIDREGQERLIASVNFVKVAE